MNNDAIGVFDSGVGGLTAVIELNRLLPSENIIYFGDTARIPYGSRSKETVLRYAREDIAFLRKHKIKMVIAACGTVSSVTGTKSLVDDLPFTGVLLPAAQAACGATRNGKIGVIGTPATIKSAGFAKAIKTIRPNTTVIGNPCPLLVHLVENGYTDRNSKILQLALEEYLTPIKASGVDVLILGCTHYPLVSEAIGDFMGSGVKLISTGEEAAKYAEKVLISNDLLTESTDQGTNVFYVSDSVELFEENAKHFMRSEIKGKVFAVNINE